VISAFDLATICSDLYTDAGTWDHTWDCSGTHAAHRKVGEIDVIVFRGSKDVEDWICDIEAFPVWDAKLGFVHGGFLWGMNDALAQILTVVGPRVAVTGHSLGGARARIMAGMLACMGRPVEQCVVFGSPRPAFANLMRVLQKSLTPMVSYRNRNDPVPLVPYMAGLYTHPDTWITLDTAPAVDNLEPLRDHHIALYLEGLSR
jgi:hypothetical protein